MNLSLAGKLAIALAISLIINVVLFWNYAQSGPKCELGNVKKDYSALDGTRKAEDKRNESSSAASKTADANADKAMTETSNATNKAHDNVRYIYRTTPAPAASCPDRPLPDGVQLEFDKAVDRANRAGG